MTYIGLARCATNLGQKQVHAERRIWVLQVLFQSLDLLRSRTLNKQIPVSAEYIIAGLHQLREDLTSTHLLSQNLGRVPDTSDHTEAACVGDSSGKLRTRCDVHPCKNCELSYCQRESH